MIFALLITALIPLTRYFIVHLLLKPKIFDRKDAIIAVAMGPRGLATAVLATLPLQMGVQGGAWIQEVLFAIIPLSIFMTALGVFIAENRRLRQKINSLFKKFPESVAKTGELR